MRSLHRYPDHTALDIRGGQRRPEAFGRASPLAGSGRGDEGRCPPVVEAPPTLERWDLVESRWGLGSAVVLLAGAALAVLGVVAAGRTGSTTRGIGLSRPWRACATPLCWRGWRSVWACCW